MARWFSRWGRNSRSETAVVEPTSSYQWTCACCGKAMVGLPMDIGYSWPETYNPDSDQISTLSDDFCRIEHPDGDIDRAIRCVLHIPVQGREETFGFGVWMSVSEQSWDIYSKGFKSGVYEKPGCFGYVFNSLPFSKSALLLHANVTFGDADSRPVVWLHDADHPLVEAQRDGVSISQVEKWVSSVMRHHN